MHVTSLEIILAVVAVFVVFGPRELPQRTKKPESIKVVERERAPLILRTPSEYAAGRAPSPLQLRAAADPMRTPGQDSATDRPQFAEGDLGGSPLPHELLRV